MPKKLPRNVLEQMFKTEVADRSEAIDEVKYLDWYSLALGWAIGKGLSPDEAHDFANHILHEPIWDLPAFRRPF